jgi:hypothetical protein
MPIPTPTVKGVAKVIAKRQARGGIIKKKGKFSIDAFPKNRLIAKERPPIAMVSRNVRVRMDCMKE